jgi:hypothetical protein
MIVITCNTCHGISFCLIEEKEGEMKNKQHSLKSEIEIDAILK